jgi:D-glycero-D-manno-heptose 1,7-bisphosphate phosphatase
MLHEFRPPFAPLPGTIPHPRGLFIDRWGTLLEAPPRGHAREPDEVRFFPGVLSALFRATRAGWRIYLLGNEDAVAQGELSLEAWQAVEAKILGTLAAGGVVVSRQYACIDHPSGVAGRQGDSVYLLPNTGAFYHASHEDGVELGKSWVIGDSTLELVAGWRAGVRVAAVRTGLALGDRTFGVDPEMWAANLAEALEALLGTREALSA